MKLFHVASSSYASVHDMKKKTKFKLLTKALFWNALTTLLLGVLWSLMPSTSYITFVELTSS